MTWQNNLKLILPPVALKAFRSVRDHVKPPEKFLEYAPHGWNTRLPADAGPGYSFQKVIEIERSEYEPLMRQLRCGVLDLSSANPDKPASAQMQRLEDHNIYMSFAYVLALAVQNREHLRLLDYGGNLGYYYCIARLVTPHISLDYHCKELPAMAEQGRRLNPEVKWHTDDSCLDQEFDLTIFSGVLPYIQEWQTLLRRAAASTTRYLYIAFQPTIESVASYVAIQHFRGAAMLYQLINRREVSEVAQSLHLRVIREFWYGEHLPIRNAPEQPFYCGWLFEKS